MPDGIHEASTDLALEEAMRPFLSELTIPQRDAVRLVWWERMTEREAAEALGLSHHSTVQERLEGAYTKLRKALSAAVPPDYAEKVALGEMQPYRAVRQMLTPSEVIDVRGFRDRSEDARCMHGGEFLARYLANGLGLDPWLVCWRHR